MIRLDHLAIPVRNRERSRESYATHELTAKGVVFEKNPQKLFWGYGAELRDPDGHLVYLWDERSMREKGG